MKLLEKDLLISFKIALYKKAIRENTFSILREKDTQIRNTKTSNLILEIKQILKRFSKDEMLYLQEEKRWEEISSFFLGNYLTLKKDSILLDEFTIRRFTPYSKKTFLLGVLNEMFDTYFSKKETSPEKAINILLEKEDPFLQRTLKELILTIYYKKASP